MQIRKQQAYNPIKGREELDKAEMIMSGMQYFVRPKGILSFKCNW